MVAMRGGCKPSRARRDATSKTLRKRSCPRMSLFAMTQAPAVMFVDDEDEVRAPLAALVRIEGFRVFEARNTPEALRVLAQEHVDVLFTDVVMPEPDGIELAERARHLQPHIRIIFATGYLLRAATADRMGKLLFKPVRAKDILGALNEVMQALTTQPLRNIAPMLGKADKST
jgi:YesN/AraC family two-component response regulator